MRDNGIYARHKRRYKVTTDSKHGLPVAENLLARKFTPAAPNQVWTSDITYLWTDEGWLYLAIVLDLFNREIVDWSLKPRMTSDIVTDALTMAWFRKRPAAGLLHRSDRGSQYASQTFQDKLNAYGMICSMSRKGNCWDNAPTESWFNSFKNERVHGLRFAVAGGAAKRKIEAASKHFEQVQLRTRSIQRKLKSVEAIPAPVTPELLGIAFTATVGEETEEESADAVES